MALDKAAAVAAMTSVFEDLTPGGTAADKAQAMMDLLDIYVKTALVKASIPAGTVAVTAEIPIGVVSQGASPAVVVNVAPIPITITFNVARLLIEGDPDEPASSDTEGGLS